MKDDHTTLFSSVRCFFHPRHNNVNEFFGFGNQLGQFLLRKHAAF